MPLDQSASCEAFWKNRAKLIKEGKEDSQATAIAARIMKDNGGDPDKCLGQKKD